LERKHVSFGLEPDEWHVYVDGKIEIYSSYYISVYEETKLQNGILVYNSAYQYGDYDYDKKR
tara:strand:- start:14397 stop:14582 length:186 start_codon:yes stop_codon:yes gene_type:complete